MSKIPYVWQMVKEAIEALGGTVSNSEIRDYIQDKYGDVNENTINSHIIMCTVNQPSRIHYTQNKKPRFANSQYDFLFSIGRGRVAQYDPETHGIWEIRKDEYGKLVVAQTDIEEPPELEDELDGPDQEFPVEPHLRDFIANNIETIRVNDSRLTLYADETDRVGIEYPTEVGWIDILAIDEADNFVIFELKVRRGIDKAFGQLSRYMGWVKAHLAKGKDVKGVIVAKTINKKLKYAASTNPDISLFEYELNFKIHPVSIEKRGGNR